MEKRFIPAFLLVLLLTGCSSIEVGEDQLFQNKPTITPADFSMEGVALEELFVEGAGGTRLNAWHLTQPGAQGTVVYFGGNGFFLVHAKNYIEAMSAYPINLFLVNYRGYGKSAGEPSVKALQRDALAVFDYVVDSTEARLQTTVVHGHSMGTFMAARVYGRARGPAARGGGHHPAKPGGDGGGVDGRAHTVVPGAFYLAGASAPLKAVNNVVQVRAIEEPLLIVGGAQDNITVPAMARRLHEVAPPGRKQLAVIDSVGHNIPYENAMYRRVLSGFLGDVLPGRFAATGASGAVCE